MKNQHNTASKGAVLAIVIVPFLGLIAAIIVSWRIGVIDIVSFSLFVAFSVIRILGITIGFHRLFTHKSFKTHPWVKIVLGVMGSMAVEGKVNVWVADHRRHHVDSDQEGDPHSPNLGFIHAHIGWMLSDPGCDHDRFVPDLIRDKAVAFVDRHFALWAFLGLALPAYLGFVLSHSWLGALQGFLWGGLASVCFVHHDTWSINSICHIFGSRPFDSGDESRNNIVLGYLALGEGWHHNHHVFERSAKHGLFWWQPDASYCLIRCLEDFRLAWDIHVPSDEDIQARLLVP